VHSALMVAQREGVNRSAAILTKSKSDGEALGRLSPGSSPSPERHCHFD
jgi:hypothetical protein